MSDLFIDTHCHFFSSQHIPLTQSIQRIEKNLGKYQLALMGGSAAGSALTSMFGPVVPAVAYLYGKHKTKEIHEKLTRFIHFFDRDVRYNIEEVINSLRDVTDFNIPQRKAVFTPLIMDFEKVADYKPLTEQAKDLKSSIHAIRDKLSNLNSCVLPFLGIDLRRFHGLNQNQVEQTLDGIIAQTVGSIQRYTRSDIETSTPNGEFIGIKLYPSLGFDLADPNNRDSYKQLLRILAGRDIPVTVHCQVDSYEGGDPEISDKVLDNYAHPHKWIKLIEESGANNIRLNLGHFGGEDGVKQCLEWTDENHVDWDDIRPYRPAGPAYSKKHSWTYAIIKLLKKYPHVYSDISAFDFKRDERAAATLLWLIDYDNRDKLNVDGQYKLIDKLMWGSDVPMTLFDNENYQEQFGHFVTRMDTGGYNSIELKLPTPGENGFPDQAQMIEKLINHNPAKFLFG